MQVIKKRNTREPLNQQKTNSIVNYEGWIQDRENRSNHKETILSTYQNPMLNTVNAQWTEFEMSQNESKYQYPADQDLEPLVQNVYIYRLNFKTPYNGLYNIIWDGSDPPWLHEFNYDSKGRGIYNWSFTCSSTLNGTNLFTARHAQPEWWKNDGTETISLSFYCSKNMNMVCQIVLYQDGKNFDLEYPYPASDIFKYCSLQFVVFY